MEKNHVSHVLNYYYIVEMLVTCSKSTYVPIKKFSLAGNSLQGERGRGKGHESYVKIVDRIDCYIL